MNRYLTIHIPETSAPAPVSHFLRTQAGLTKKQISQAKFRPGGIRKNGQQCRVTENAYPGDQIIVCLEADDVDSAQLESSSFTVFHLNSPERARLCAYAAALAVVIIKILSLIILYGNAAVGTIRNTEQTLLTFFPDDNRSLGSPLTGAELL